ncbi:MAG TPA: phage holin family protein [Mycobacteriales bacterium]|nr:phage holin family protein [Mycobacteriales bacterium]
MSTLQSPDPEPSVGELVRRASENVSTLVRGEIELAKAELSTTVKRAGVGGGMLAAAAAVLLFSVPFLFVVIAEVLVAIGLPRWLSYLIVWVFFLLVAGLLALIGRRQLKKMKKPERTLRTAKDTAAWARHPTSTTPTTPTA